MQIFKLIKNKIKLFKKTKEEKLSLLISGKNTLLEVSNLSKSYDYHILFIFLFLSTIPFMATYALHMYIVDGALTIKMTLPHLLSFIIPFSLLSRLFIENPDINILWRDLFKNAKLPYLIKNAKQINNYLLSTKFSKNVHGFIFNEHINNDEYCEFLYADIDNVGIFFNYLKDQNKNIFNEFYKLRKFIIEKSDPVSLEILDTIYNKEFLNNDLDSYIKSGKSDQDKEILDYLGIYGCKSKLHMYFKINHSNFTQNYFKYKNKNSTELNALLNDTPNDNKNTIEFNLINQKEEIYANF